MLLCYAMLCYALQGAVPKLSFLAKPCQPNGHDDQIILADPLVGDKLDTPTTHGHLWHGPNHEPAHNYNYSHDHSLNNHSLSSRDTDLRP